MISLHNDPHLYINFRYVTLRYMFAARAGIPRYMKDLKIPAITQYFGWPQVVL